MELWNVLECEASEDVAQVIRITQIQEDSCETDARKILWDFHKDFCFNSPYSDPPVVHPRQLFACSQCDVRPA